VPAIKEKPDPPSSTFKITVNQERIYFRKLIKNIQPIVLFVTLDLVNPRFLLSNVSPRVYSNPINCLEIWQATQYFNWNFISFSLTL
jgi:hypothetical protein